MKSLMGTFAVIENIVIFSVLSYVVFGLNYSGWWFLIGVLFMNSSIKTIKQGEKR